MTFEEAEKKFIEKKPIISKSEKTFLKKALVHLIGIARCKAKGKKDEMSKHHEGLDNVIHNFAGKREGE